MTDPTPPPAGSSSVAGNAAPVGERPLADCVADFWRGDFTLRGDGEDGGDAEQSPTTSALAALGPSGITVRGRDLAALLEPAYRTLSS
ncbi:hypothetical protein [Kitasatospora sp. NPDC050543]|uniref:hypothetical protein n=1 Tax=Kitasatospora sp. NPDC050543 TaxID=3364054 RepID=UPI00378D61F6